jgi:hypothetical protein
MVCLGHLIQWAITIRIQQVPASTVHTVTGLLIDVFDKPGEYFLPVIPNAALAALGGVIPQLFGRRRWLQILLGTVCFAAIQSFIDWRLLQPFIGLHLEIYRWLLGLGILLNTIGGIILATCAAYCFDRLRQSRRSISDILWNSLVRRGIFVVLFTVGIAGIAMVRVPIGFQLVFSSPRSVVFRHYLPLGGLLFPEKKVSSLAAESDGPVTISSYVASSPLLFSIGNYSIIDSNDFAKGVRFDEVAKRELNPGTFRVAAENLSMVFGANPIENYEAMCTAFSKPMDLFIERNEKLKRMSPSSHDSYIVKAIFQSPEEITVGVAQDSRLTVLLNKGLKFSSVGQLSGPLGNLFRPSRSLGITLTTAGRQGLLYRSDDSSPFWVVLKAKTPDKCKVTFKAFREIRYAVSEAGFGLGSIMAPEVGSAEEIEAVIHDGGLRQGFSSDRPLGDGDRIVVHAASEPLHIRVEDSGAIDVSGSYSTLSVNGEYMANTVWSTVLSESIRSKFVWALCGAGLLAIVSRWKRVERYLRRHWPDPKRAWAWFRGE